jgi:nucleotide-binding universal stress UspA family protein
MINIKKILYATDFSSHSNQAYFHAVALAEGHGADLIILHVYSPTAADLEGMVPDSRSEDLDVSYWRQQLEQIHPVNSGIRVHHVLLEGSPADEIVRYATEQGIDLIVMGTHGRTGLERLLMGSVAEKVVRGAPCSVLVAKMPKRMVMSQPAEKATPEIPAPLEAMPGVSQTR